MAVPFFDNRGVEKRPNYTYRTKSEQLSKYTQFIKDVKNFAYIYETENEEAGRKLLLENKNKIDFNHVKENATDKLSTLVDIAEEELTEEETINLLFDSSEPEPGPGVSQNSLLLIPVKQIKTNLNKFPGKINTVTYDNIYKVIKKGLSSKEIEEAHDKADVEIMNGILYQDPNYDFWQAVIDEDLFKEKLVEKLEADEKELDEKYPAVARVLVKVLGRMV